MAKPKKLTQTHRVVSNSFLYLRLSPKDGVSQGKGVFQLKTNSNQKLFMIIRDAIKTRVDICA